MTDEEREKAGSKSDHKTAKERAQAHQASRGANIDKPEADGTGGLYTDKKWSELTKDQKEEIKVIHAQGPDGEFKGAKDSFQDQRAKSMGYDSEQSKKDDWEQKRNNSSSENGSSTQSNQTSSSLRISSGMEGYGTDKKYRGPDGGMYTAKEADNAGWTPGYYDEGAGGAELVGKVDPKQAKLDENEAYRQSRIDIQNHKAQFGPENVYGRQSARDTHERSMSRGNPKVTGPQAQTSADMIAANELAKNLYDSGYDYSHNEMIRHRNGGADLSKTNSYLYDEYGGYDNWYNNHSLYSGNFTGSKDLMDFDKVMEVGQQQQDALKNYQTSDEYMSKYGQYDWAKDFNEKYGQGAN